MKPVRSLRSSVSPGIFRTGKNRKPLCGKAKSFIGCWRKTSTMSFISLTSTPFNTPTSALRLSGHTALRPKKCPAWPLIKSSAPAHSKTPSIRWPKKWHWTTGPGRRTPAGLSSWRWNSIARTVQQLQSKPLTGFCGMKRAAPCQLSALPGISGSVEKRKMPCAKANNSIGCWRTIFPRWSPLSAWKICHTFTFPHRWRKSGDIPRKKPFTSRWTRY